MNKNYSIASLHFMIPLLTLIILAISLLSAPRASAGENVSMAYPSVSGALQVTGTQLSDADGNPVQLKGISTHGIAWYPEYINKECFAQLHDEWNINLIRLAMYTEDYAGYCSGGDREYLKSLIRSGVEYATELDMYVIIDWHILSDGNPNTHKDEAAAFFDEMSSEYAEYTNVLYEICNEPNGNVSWADIKSYAEEIIPVIRANDPDAVIIVGTPNWSQYLNEAAADPITGYDNIMYTLHFYAATHTDSLRNTMTAAIEAGLPVFVTEYGICDASGSGAIDEDQADRWINLLDSYGVSYAMWNLSNKDESSAMLKSDCTKTSGFTFDDLSTAGKWLYQMMTGSLDEAEAIAEEAYDFAGTEAEAVPEESYDFAATEALSDGTIEYTAEVVGQWESGGAYFFQYNITLKNISGSELSSWNVSLEFNSSISLSDGWNGEYTANGSVLNITPKDYNSTVPAGGTVSDIGFIISGSSDLAIK